jgi:hypothetical protein
MFLFITSILVVSFISLCFFGKRFWENRYMILLIIAAVSFIATIVTNYVVRGKLETKSEVLTKKPLYPFYLQDSLYTDSLKIPLIKNFHFFDYKDVYFTNKKDKKHTQTKVRFVIYTKKKNTYVGVYKKGNKWNYLINDIYIAPSSADSVSYVCKKRLVYDVLPTNWLTGFSMPRISTERILYVPPKEYILIPDSLIRKIPF